MKLLDQLKEEKERSEMLDKLREGNFNGAAMFKEKYTPLDRKEIRAGKRG